MKVSKITKRLPSLPRSGPFPLTNVQFMKFMELVKAVLQAVRAGGWWSELIFVSALR